MNIVLTSESRSVARCSNASPGSGLDISTDCTVASKFQMLGSSKIWLPLVSTRPSTTSSNDGTAMANTIYGHNFFFIRVFVVGRVLDGGWSSLQTEVIMGIIEGGLSRLLLVFFISKW